MDDGNQMTTIVGDAKRKIIVSDSQTSDDDSDTSSDVKINTLRR